MRWPGPAAAACEGIEHGTFLREQRMQVGIGESSCENGRRYLGAPRQGLFSCLTPLWCVIHVVTHETGKGESVELDFFAFDELRDGKTDLRSEVIALRKPAGHQRLLPEDWQADRAQLHRGCCVGGAHWVWHRWGGVRLQTNSVRGVWGGRLFTAYAITPTQSQCGFCFQLSAISACHLFAARQLEAVARLTTSHRHTHRCPTPPRRSAVSSQP